MLMAAGEPKRTVEPRGKVKLTVPRLTAPSASWRLAVRMLLLVATAVKEKGREIAAAPRGTRPEYWGPVGELTPAPARREATRSVVSADPVFRRNNWRVTRSPASMPPVAGAASDCKRAPEATMMNEGLRLRVTAVATLSRMLGSMGDE